MLLLKDQIKNYNFTKTYVPLLPVSNQHIVTTMRTRARRGKIRTQTREPIFKSMQRHVRVTRKVSD